MSPVDSPSPKDAAADGATISWKENFDSAYTELNEIGR
jgi:kalirin